MVFISNIVDQTWEQGIIENLIASYGRREFIYGFNNGKCPLNMVFSIVRKGCRWWLISLEAYNEKIGYVRNV